MKALPRARAGLHMPTICAVVWRNVQEQHSMVLIVRTRSCGFGTIMTLAKHKPITKDDPQMVHVFHPSPSMTWTMGCAERKTGMGVCATQRISFTGKLYSNNNAIFDMAITVSACHRVADAMGSFKCKDGLSQESLHATVEKLSI